MVYLRSSLERGQRTLKIKQRMTGMFAEMQRYKEPEILFESTFSNLVIRNESDEEKKRCQHRMSD